MDSISFFAFFIQIVAMFIRRSIFCFRAKRNNNVNSDAWMEGLSIEELTEARDVLEEYQQQAQSDAAFDNYLDTLSVNELYDLRDALDDETDGDAKVLRMG